ncbi:hypothetical protein [Streptomyces sp. NPDC056255]|uniref:hypothetical protein n=1 Tax=Streptomyces sp. NPDC056255 TaxID=3345764 RepID=UPI0035DE79C7
MTFDEVKPDIRVVVDSRGGIRATVLTKRPNGFGADRPVVRLAADNGAEFYNYPEQLTPLDEPTPAPKLSASHSVIPSFWFGGHEYEVWNATGVGNVRGYWTCTRRNSSGTARTDGDYVVRNAETRTAAFNSAVAALRSATNARTALIQRRADGNHVRGRVVTVKGKDYVVGRVVTADQQKAHEYTPKNWKPKAYVNYWSERDGMRFGAIRTTGPDAKPGTVGRAIWDAVNQ